MPLHIDTLFLVIDFLGVFVGALGGALTAVRDTRYKYDLVGVTGLAFASALGGGITRDLILQKGPPLAFVDVRYLMAALAGAAVGLAFAARVGRSTERVIIFIDAVALGLFAVAGSTRALESGLRRLPAFLLGGVTAVGGGCIRDVLSGLTPKIFARRALRHCGRFQCRHVPAMRLATFQPRNFHDHRSWLRIQSATAGPALPLADAAREARNVKILRCWLRRFKTGLHL
jgi:uncharacterized membrane protein YeiH